MWNAPSSPVKSSNGKRIGKREIWKYLVRVKTIDGREVVIVTKLGPTQETAHLQTNGLHKESGVLVAGCILQGADPVLTWGRPMLQGKQRVEAPRSRLIGKLNSDGMDMSQHVSFTGFGKAVGGQPRSEPDSGKPTVRDHMFQ